MREPLERETGLSFLPRDYTVWRNYGRMFQCALLATQVDSHLRVTDLCARLAAHGEDAMDSDEYFVLFAKRFYAPFPAFIGYNPHATQSFPLCAVMRFLLSKAKRNEEPTISLDEVFSLLIGNECRGNEPLDKYSTLTSTDYAPSDDEKRQVREMLVAFSQFSFLKWFSNRLTLDLAGQEKQTLSSLEQLFHPVVEKRLPDRGRELLQIGSVAEISGLPVPVPTGENAGDVSFTEGKKTRVTHLRTERNRSLRRVFFERLPPPYRCDMCGAALNERYPWVGNLLLLHHLLPLSSPIRIGTEGTTLDDLVPVCPNCHDAIHAYYKRWLSINGLEDFPTKDEARQAYEEAKEQMRETR